ncbi:outer membrane beta-barrel family protein [Parabacteroides sp.]
MRKRAVILLAMLIAISGGSVNAQSFLGKLVDDKEAPVGFANVVLLNPEDSAFVKGTVSEESGEFVLEGLKEQCYILRVSYIGYKDICLDCPKTGDVGTIRLEPDAIALGEAVVTGKLPTYQLKGSSLVTNIQETLLSTVGTANDVLSHIPGLESSDGKYTVFGKGEPLIYINNRLVRDNSELERLSSKDISKVELIQNPGAEYDATVKAVLKIRTVRRAGEGLGVNIRTNISQGHKTGNYDQLNLNYRKNGLDLFGMVGYNLYQRKQDQNTGMYVRTDTLWEQDAAMDADVRMQSVYGELGVNYEVNEHQSLGVAYTGDRALDSYFDMWSGNTVYADGAVYDYLRYRTRMGQGNSQHKMNAYYEGKLNDKLNISLNLDWVNGSSENTTYADEDSETSEDRLVTTDNRTRSHLYAAKLVMTYPLGTGQLKWGGEYSYVRRTDRFDNPQSLLPSSDTRIREQNAAAFLGYDWVWDKLNATIGLRFEHVDFDYYDQEIFQPGQSRLYDNLFPDISLSLPVGKTQMSLSYTSKTNRPSFYQLRSNLQYDDRFTYEGGNPLLKPSFNHDLTYQFGYKFLQLSASYQYVKDVSFFMMKAYEPDPTITVFSQQNYPKAQYLNVSVSLSPKFDFWEPSLYMNVSKQFFEAVTMGEMRKFNKPSYYFSLNNSFRLPRGWIFSLDGNIRTEGNRMQTLNKRSGSVNVGLRKSFLKDESLTLNLQGFDLFATERYSFVMYAADRSVTKWNYSDSRQVRLTVTYRFNATRSKYKGSGAANEVINRL